MEKNYWLALALSMIVLMGYPFLMKKVYPPKPVESPEQMQAIQKVVTQARQELRQRDAAPQKTQAETVAVHNELYDIEFSTQGAGIRSLVYKGEKEKDHRAGTVFFKSKDQEPGAFELRVLHDEIDTTRTNYSAGTSSGNGAEFVFEKAGQYKLTKRFSAQRDRPVIFLDVTLENLSAGEKIFPLELTSALDYEKSHEPQHNAGAVYFQEKVKSENLDKIKKKGFSLGGGMEWAGFLKKYFTLLIKTDFKMISSESRADEQNLYSTIRFEPVIVPAGGTVTKQILIYAGPQRYETLKAIGLNFEEILSRGFFGLFKIWLLISLKFLHQFTHNFGWAIILLTFALKLLFTPLTHMSYESMRKMQAIQPKMKALQERYKSDPQKMNREVMELYRRNKVNPMGGCLPMVAQIPIFIAFYQVLSETIELKGAPFMFWIHDLAQPDRLYSFPFTVPILGWDAFNLLPVFMIASMVWQQKLTPQTTTSPEQAKMMEFMPIMMGFLFYQMPAGLVLYWFLNNMLTVFHQLVIKRMGAVILHHEDRD